LGGVFGTIGEILRIRLGYWREGGGEKGGALLNDGRGGGGVSSLQR